jgi:hypothetical protein
MQAGRKVARVLVWCVLLTLGYAGSFVMIGVLYQRGFVPEGLSLPFGVLYSPLLWVSRNVPLAEDALAWSFHFLGGM